MKLYSGRQISKMDQEAINSFKIRNMVLMENAGRETCKVISEKLGSPHGYALIFIGPGNNGGDGFVIGRTLLQQGCIPLFFILADVDKLPVASKENYSICHRLNLSINVLDRSKRITTQIEKVIKKQIPKHQKCFVIIDSIFGIGLKRNIEGFYARTIKAINTKRFINSAVKPPLFACDIPSGIHSVTGQVLGTAIKADYTTTYSFGKPGLFQGIGKLHTGHLTICDIGIPPVVSEKVKSVYNLARNQEASKLLDKIARSSSCHKGNNGHVAIVGGSTKMAGAAILTGLASASTGSGFTTNLIPSALNNVFKCSIPEAMTIPLHNPDHIVHADHSEIMGICSDKIMVIGPGIGLKNDSCKCIRQIYRKHHGTIVMDADAINAIAQSGKKLISNPGGDRIFTPHPGEMARLLNCSIAKVQKNRIKAIKSFIKIFKNCPFDISIILKGESTLIANNRSSHITINTSGNPGMATGGMRRLSRHRSEPNSSGLNGL